MIEQRLRTNNAGNGEKASSPWHGCAISRSKYLGFKSVYERTSRKPPERASYPWTWLCYFTSLAEVLRLRTNNTGNCAVFLANPSVGYIFVATISSAKNTHLKKKQKHLTKIQGSHSNTNTRNLPTKNFQNHLPNKGSAPSNPNTRDHKNLNLQKTFPSNLNIRNVAPSPRSAPHIDQDDRVAELTVPGWSQRWSILPGVGLNSLLGNLYWIASAFRFVDLFFAHLVWLRLTGNRQKEQVTRKRG